MLKEGLNEPGCIFFLASHLIVMDMCDYLKTWA
jgi:hypothetical protein